MRSPACARCVHGYAVPPTTAREGPRSRIDPAASRQATRRSRRERAQRCGGGHALPPHVAPQTRAAGPGSLVVRPPSNAEVYDSVVRSRHEVQVSRISVAFTTRPVASARSRARGSKPSRRDQSPTYGDGLHCACRPATRSTACVTERRCRRSSSWRASVARFSSRSVSVRTPRMQASCARRRTGSARPCASRSSFSSSRSPACSPSTSSRRRLRTLRSPFRRAPSPASGRRRRPSRSRS